MSYDVEQLQADIAQVQHPGAGFGTGRLVAENLVLTAAHTLWDRDGQGPFETDWQVLLERDRGPEWQFRRGNKVAWYDRELDLALIQLVNPAGGPLRPGLRLRVATVLRNNAHPVEARGYPRASKETGPRKLALASGDLDAVGQNEPLRLGVKESDLPNSPHDDWPGMSGSVVLLREAPDPAIIWVYGVILEVPTYFSGQLRVSRLANAWQEDAAFRKLLVEAGVPDQDAEDPSRTATEAAGTNKLHSVPILPPHYLVRSELHERVISALLVDEGHAGRCSYVGLHGMAGIGKTVTASAIARDPRICARYSDGVFWLTVGMEPDLDELQAELSRSLGSARTCTDARQWREHLSELFFRRCCLLVLDDVWSTDHLREFDVLSSSSQLLLTTREGSLLTGTGAVEEKLDVLTQDESLWLLSQWSGRAADELDAVANDLIRECGYLPLALAVCGAMVRDAVFPTDVLSALRDSDLEFIGHRGMNYQYPNVLKALKASVDFMRKQDPADADRYLELGVFPRDAAIPERAILTLWCSSGEMKPRSARKLLAELARKALLTLVASTPDQTIVLHDLQHDFIHSQYEAD